MNTKIDPRDVPAFYCKNCFWSEDPSSPNQSDSGAQWCNNCPDGGWRQDVGLPVKSPVMHDPAEPGDPAVIDARELAIMRQMIALGVLRSEHVDGIRESSNPGVTVCAGQVRAIELADGWVDIKAFSIIRPGVDHSGWDPVPTTQYQHVSRDPVVVCDVEVEGDQLYSFRCHNDDEHTGKLSDVKRVEADINWGLGN